MDRNYDIHTNTMSHKLESVTSKEDIGVIFESKLEFDLHINEKINKTNSLCGMIRWSYKFLNYQIFLPLYKTLVR